MNSTEVSRRPAVWLVMACALAAAVFYFSLSRTIVSIPGDAGGHLGHAIAYGSLMFMLARGSSDNRSRVLAAAGLFAIGVCIELLQARTGYRSYEYADMAANGLGVALGWLGERTLLMLQSLRRVPAR
jgi:VanZ family protein